MKARDVMTPRVTSIAPDDTVLKAARLMLQHQISGLPVVDKGGALVGVVTEGDFLRRAETGTERHRASWLEFVLGPGRLAKDYTRFHARKVQEVMTCPPYTVTEDTPLEDVVELMERKRIKRLPVVRGQQMVGIVSRANLLHALASLAHEAQAKAPALDDGEIRERLIADLNEQAWAPLANINIIVRNGIVELWGVILDERDRNALIVAAENVPNVKGVRDHLTSIEPMSGMVLYQGDDEPQVRAS
jgi:CBS domain-containing protein